MQATNKTGGSTTMFEKIKKRKMEKFKKEKNNYFSFDDFITMMLDCSEEQFESTFNWFKSMRKPKL